MAWEEGEKGRENLMKKFGMSQGGPEVLQHTALQCTEDRSPPMTIHISSTLTVDTSSTLQSVLREECRCDLHWAMSTSHLSDRSCNTTDRLGCPQLHVRPLWKPSTECSAPGLLLLVKGRENDRTGPSQGSSNAERSFRRVTSPIDKLAMKPWQWIWQMEHPGNSFPLQIKICCMLDEQLLPNACNWSLPIGSERRERAHPLKEMNSPFFWDKKKKKKKILMEHSIFTKNHRAPFICKCWTSSVFS